MFLKRIDSISLRLVAERVENTLFFERNMSMLLKNIAKSAAVLGLVCGTLGLASPTDAAIVVTATAESSQIGAAYTGLSFPNGYPNDLTTLGTTDWAYWQGEVGGVITELNGKSAGSGIGLPVFANPNRNGTVQNQIGGYVGTHFAFTDGTAPASNVDLTSAGVTAQRGGSLTYSNDPGPSFQFSAPVGIADNTLYVWFSAYKAVGTNAFNITVWDGLTQIGSTLTADGAPGGDTGTAYVYKFVYGGDTTTSGNLDFKFQMTDGNQDNATFTLNAAALQAAAVPEPASIALLGLLGLGGLLLLPRRRNA